MPKRTQEELNYLLDAIQRKVKDCEMIILYGSYARGGYVLWDEQIENGVHTSYQSDLDILVVVSNGNVRLKEQSIRSKVVEKYHEKFAYRRHAFPQIILVELAAHAKIFTRAFTTAFPVDTEFGKHCYDLLCRAYIEARYNKYFDVTREEYEYMLEKVSLLREVTLRVCQERFAYYDQMIAEEES